MCRTTGKTKTPVQMCDTHLTPLSATLLPHHSVRDTATPCFSLRCWRVLSCPVHPFQHCPQDCHNLSVTLSECSSPQSVRRENCTAVHSSTSNFHERSHTAWHAVSLFEIEDLISLSKLQMSAHSTYSARRPQSISPYLLCFSFPKSFMTSMPALESALPTLMPSALTCQHPVEDPEQVLLTRRNVGICICTHL